MDKIDKLISEFVLGCNQQNNFEYECDYLEGDSVYVNVKSAESWHAEDFHIIYDADAHCMIADHICALLNQSAASDKEWVRYSEPNYWKDGVEADDIEDADTIQYMIYEKDINQ